MESGRNKTRHLAFRNYGDTENELKEKIQAYYNMLDINLKAKSTDIGKYSETENTTKLIESKRENGIRIVRFI